MAMPEKTEIYARDAFDELRETFGIQLTPQEISLGPVQTVYLIQGPVFRSPYVVSKLITKTVPASSVDTISVEETRFNVDRTERLIGADLLVGGTAPDQIAITMFTGVTNPIVLANEDLMVNAEVAYNPGDRLVWNNNYWCTMRRLDMPPRWGMKFALSTPANVGNMTINLRLQFALIE